MMLNFYEERIHHLEAEIQRLKTQLEGAYDRIAQQSELLSRRAERPTLSVFTKDGEVRHPSLN